MYDDGMSGGMEIISLIGNSEKLDRESLEPCLEECIGGLFGLGLITEKNDFLYLTLNGKRIYTKLQNKYDN